MFSSFKISGGKSKRHQSDWNEYGPKNRKKRVLGFKLAQLTKKHCKLATLAILIHNNKRSARNYFQSASAARFLEGNHKPSKVVLQRGGRYFKGHVSAHTQKNCFSYS